jgi:hypothetical protein
VTATRLLRGLFLVGGLTLGFPAIAQDAGDDAGLDSLDASLPDASVGGSSADNGSEDQGDGQPVVNCNFTSDCDRGFVCQSGKCTYSGYRNATNGGCSGAPAFAGLGLGGLALRIRRKRK